jgi:hypothetical protein
MYLLRTSDYSLHYFAEPHIPDYAILSHRWDRVELSYADLRSKTDVQNAVGFAKIRGCCKQARSDGWEYVWMDTCNIDKSSSAELSEAINSMFRYYQNAQVCYVWLRDVQHRSLDDTGPMTFRSSAWFTRGWTLQELLAPRLLIFYDRSWTEIGTRQSLEETIASITGITLPLDDWRSKSVAQKMSWASRRKTSRVEDIAYCLLGLFGVSMAPLYGEGANAFLRLQLEIIGKTDDQSIFAWTQITPMQISTISTELGLLAGSPAAFLNSQDIQQKVLPGKMPSYSVTNRGLRLEQQTLLPIEWLGPSLDVKSPNLYLAVLNCSQGTTDNYLGIYLQQHPSLDDFGRVRISELGSFPGQLLEQTWDRTPAPVMYVRQLLENPDRDIDTESCWIDLTFARDKGYLPPTIEASEPHRLFSPADTPWERVLVFSKPFANPMWAMFTFRSPDIPRDDFEVLFARDETGFSAYIAIPPQKFERPAKRLRGPIGKKWGLSGHPYWDFPMWRCELPSGKWVDSHVQHVETDKGHAYNFRFAFGRAAFSHNMNANKREEHNPGEDADLAEGRVLFDTTVQKQLLRSMSESYATGDFMEGWTLPISNFEEADHIVADFSKRLTEIEDPMQFDLLSE